MRPALLLCCEETVNTTRSSLAQKREYSIDWKILVSLNALILINVCCHRLHLVFGKKKSKSVWFKRRPFKYFLQPTDLFGNITHSSTTYRVIHLETIFVSTQKFFLTASASCSHWNKVLGTSNLYFWTVAVEWKCLYLTTWHFFVDSQNV